MWTKRAPLGWEVPGAILVFALAAAFGPTSAVRLSITSQAKLVGRWLDDAGAGRTVGAAPGAVRIEVDPRRHRDLRDAITELAELGGEPALRHVLSGAVDACASRWSADDCLRRLGVYPRGQAVQREAGEGEWSRLGGDGVVLLRDGVAVFAGGKETARASLAALIVASQETHVLPARLVPLVDPGGNVVAELAIQHLDVWCVDGRPPEALRLTGAIVWRR